MNERTEAQATKDLASVKLMIHHLIVDPQVWAETEKLCYTAAIDYNHAGTPTKEWIIGCFMNACSLQGNHAIPVAQVEMATGIPRRAIRRAMVKVKRLLKLTIPILKPADYIVLCKQSFDFQDEIYERATRLAEMYVDSPGRREMQPLVIMLSCLYISSRASHCKRVQTYFCKVGITEVALRSGYQHILKTVEKNPAYPIWLSELETGVPSGKTLSFPTDAVSGRVSRFPVTPAVSPSSADPLPDTPQSQVKEDT